MCWLRKASLPRTMQMVFFSSPPTARIGCDSRSQGNRHGNETAGAAEHLRAASDEADDGIVATAEDVAIVDEVGVGDAVKTPDGFVIIDGDGLFAEVGAGHDESIELAAGE